MRESQEKSAIHNIETWTIDLRLSIIQQQIFFICTGLHLELKNILPHSSMWIHIGDVMHWRQCLIPCSVNLYFYFGSKIELVLNTAPLANMYVLGHIPKEFKLNPAQISLRLGLIRDT